MAKKLLGLAGLQLVRSSALAALRAERQRLKQDLRAAPPFVLPTILGSRMFANPDDVGVHIHRLAGRSADQLDGELAYMARTVRPGQTALDIGANVGLMTLLLARQVGSSGRVYAFEPGPVSFGLLSANIGINRYTQVTAINAAVSDQSGPMDLLVCLSGESDNRISGVPVGDPDGYTKISSRSVTIDETVEGPVDFVKIDVQGAEYKALQGMRGTLARSPNVHMVVEYAPAGLSLPPQEYLAFLRSLGFALFNLPWKGSEHPASDEWILANIKWGEQTNLVLKRT